MRKLIVQEFMSLDGVVQAPSYVDEDPSGGFEHGGWHLPYLEDRAGHWLFENLNRAGGFLFGRRTYDTFAAHWPNASAAEQGFAEPLNTKPKYVVSRTLRQPLEWRHSTLLEGHVADSVDRLKREGDDELLLMGSSELAAELLANDLVDELRLMIDPIILGGGKRLFRDDGALRRFVLATSETTPTGAILAVLVRSTADVPAAPRLPRPPKARG